MKKLFLITLISALALGSSMASYYESNYNVDDFDVKDALQNMQELKNSAEKITQDLYKLDEQERSAEGQITDKYRETRKEIVSVIQDINRTTDEVGTMLKKVAVYKKQIFLTNKDLKATREDMDNTKQYTSQFSNFMYKLNNNLYTQDTDGIDELKLLLTSDNIPRTLANDHMVKSMLLQFNDLMGQLDKTEEKQIKLIRRLNHLKTKTNKKVENYEIELEKLQQKKNYLVQFMNLYKENDFNINTDIDHLFDSRKDVQKTIIALLDDIQKGTYNVPFSMSEKVEELREMTVDIKKEEVYPVAWPLYPINHIQTFFNDQTFQKQYGVPHEGVQITAKQGTPLYAARDGIVYYVADNEGIGINWIMVVHTKGYVTTYLYANKIMVKPWDIVRRWQLVGYTGWEPGTRWAGFISKGPNLTFWTYKDGLAIDPLQVLDLSIVTDKDILPDNYHIRYLNDKYARAIDVTELKMMEGKTVDARADTFLGLYGVGIYRELAFWEDAVKDTNIDRDVAICIWFAESTLGNYLSTSNNIGNVGNDDSGNRVPFWSALAGARAIAETLNNQYLGHYHTIKQLSRYGNDEGHIYASSPINWQTNVLKCLSQIKGYYIPEDYPFRIWPNPNRSKVELVNKNPNELVDAHTSAE